MKKSLLKISCIGLLMGSASGAVLLDQSGTSGAWVITTGSGVDSSTNDFDNGGFSGSRYYYGMSGGSLRAAFDESVSITAASGNQFDLTSISWSAYQFGSSSTPGAEASTNVEAFVNGVSLGVQVFDSNAQPSVKSWDATGLANMTTANVLFTITETGTGAVSFFELSPGNGLGKGLLINGDVVAVPEPSSTALLGLGGLALMLRRRR